MKIVGAAKRSSSAHALTDTDQMDENGNHSRMNLRRSNGDISRPVRLRGELETTPFIIPKSKPGLSLSRQSSFERTSSLTNKFVGSPTSFMHSKEELAASQAQMLPTQSSTRPAAVKSTEGYDSRGLLVTSNLSADTVSVMW